MNKFAQALSAALDRCIVTNTVAKQGEPVGFLYREAPVFENDSGWRFFSGDETDEYT
ncbi:immunity protein Imm33 domain-containing protein, partial [Neisseria sp. P0009.S007]